MIACAIVRSLTMRRLTKIGGAAVVLIYAQLIVGAVMRETRGRANPRLVNQLLERAIGAGSRLVVESEAFIGIESVPRIRLGETWLPSSAGAR